MIKDPPLLTVRRNFPRPSEAALRALRSVPTGFIVDCMNGRGALDYRIKPLDSDNSKFVAPIVTCHPGPGDNLAVFAALEIAQRGDAIFIATDTFTKTAVAGDNMMAMGRNRGITGFVTDGLMRDIDGILPVGLPAFCRGITPNSCTRNGPGTAGMPVVMGGICVDAGEIAVADQDVRPRLRDPTPSARGRGKPLSPDPLRFGQYGGDTRVARLGPHGAHRLIFDDHQARLVERYLWQPLGLHLFYGSVG
ncbi:MAG: RraA family protein [Candidatus Latescibacteria bacterium]|nr:RraA family protein [Candidatus Latescibacterota bacterium]